MPVDRRVERSQCGAAVTSGERTLWSIEYSCHVANNGDGIRSRLKAANKATKLVLGLRSLRAERDKFDEETSAMLDDMLGGADDDIA